MKDFYNFFLMIEGVLLLESIPLEEQKKLKILGYYCRRQTWCYTWKAELKKWGVKFVDFPKWVHFSSDKSGWTESGFWLAWCCWCEHGVLCVSLAVFVCSLASAEMSEMLRTALLGEISAVLMSWSVCGDIAEFKHPFYIQV